MSTPGVVVNGKVVHTGGIPPKEAVDSWLGRTTVDGAAGNAGDSKCCG